MCAFDLAFHDLLGLAAGMPLYRLLGGYRNRIQTSATIPIAPVKESVEMGEAHARLGFRTLKIKGRLDPAEDVHRVEVIHRALPNLVLRLDSDGRYAVQKALDVARVLERLAGTIGLLTPAHDLEGLRQATEHSPVLVLADQSVAGPGSALNPAAQRTADELSVKIATCGDCGARRTGLCRHSRGVVAHDM